MEQINFDEANLKPSQNLQFAVENLWTAIRGFVEKYQKQVEANEALRQENQTLRQNADELETKVFQLEEKVKSIEENFSPEVIQKYETMIAELREENNFLQMYYEEYQKQKKFLEGSLFGYSESDEKVKELEESLKLAQDNIVQKNLLINQLNDEILGYKERIAELENKVLQLAEKEKKLPILESTVIELQKINSERQEQLNQYKGELDVLRQQINDYDALKEKFGKLQVETRELERNLEQTAVQKIEKERELERISNQLQKLKIELEEAKRNESKIIDELGQILSIPIFSEFGFDLSRTNDYLNFFKQIVVKFEDYTNELQTLREENRQLKEALDDVRQQNLKKIEELEQEIVFHKNRIAGLEFELTAREKEKFNLDNLVKGMRADGEEMLAKIHNFELENQKLKDELDKIRSEIHLRQSKQNELLEQLEIYRTTIDDLNVQIEALNSDLLDLREKNKRLEEEMEQNTSELKRKEEQLRELIQYKNEFYKLQGEVNSLRQMNKEMKELNKQMNEEKIDLQKKIFALNKEKNDIQDNYLKAIRDKEKIEILYNEKILEYKNLNEELTKLKMILRDKEKTKAQLVEKISSLINQIDNFIGTEN